MPKHSKGQRPRVSRIWKGVKAAPPGDPMKRMMRDHEDVLQNIEFVLVTAYRRDPEVDDRLAAGALSAAIAGTPSADERAQELVGELKAMREFRAEVADDIWRDGLSVVLHSVRRHSDLRPGSTGYLDFVSRFIR